MEMKVPTINYAEVGDFDHLSCRAVIRNDKRTGEFHVRATTGFAPDSLMQLLLGIIDNADIGVIGLDYDVYIKSGSVLTTDGIEELLKEADTFIERTMHG